MKKGFTLIELLGVLAILGILAVITVPIIQGLLESGEEESKNMQIESFEKAVRSWAGTHVFAMPGPDETKELCLDQLIEEGYLDALQKDDETYYIKVNGRDSSEFVLDETCFIITNEGTSEKANYKYEYSGKIKDENGNIVDDVKSSE